MWYIGQENIEERNTGAVPYTISHREVFLQRGKVNHKLRNVITIVVGEDERYKGLLSANIDGSYNTDGDYEEYHHIGFDIEANKIVEDIDEYINNQYGTKVFWITGFGSGGSIANLVAQKLTKKKGVSNVYAYTFESFATINANNIEDANSFDYRRYTNIFNVENDDDAMIKILDRDIGWYKYGRSVRGSAAQLNTKISKILGNNFRGSSGEKVYRGSPNIVSKVINSILDAFKNVIGSITDVIDGMVSGFTSTGPSAYYENLGPGSPVIPIIDDRINLSPQDERDARQSQFQVVIGQGPGSGYANISPGVTIPILDANMPEVAQMTNNDKGLYVEEQPAKPVAGNVQYNANSSVSMLNAIELMGKWYVNHIATYDKTLKSDRASSEANTYYNYLQSHREKVIYNNTNGTIHYPSNYMQNTNTLLDERLVPNRFFYRCSDTRNGFTESQPKNLLLKNSEIKIFENKFVGDDCTCFMMAVYEYLTKSKFEPKEIEGSAFPLRYYGIDTNMIFNHIHTFGEWMYEQANVKLYTAEEVINAGGLKPGDCLLSNGERTDGTVWQGHAEFYIDDNHSFGWGDVWDTYLRNQNIVYNDGSFSFGEDLRLYTYVLRYIGE